jgi:hypothetical protein
MTVRRRKTPESAHSRASGTRDPLLYIVTRGAHGHQTQRAQSDPPRHFALSTWRNHPYPAAVDDPLLRMPTLLLQTITGASPLLKIGDSDWCSEQGVEALLR